MEWRSLFSFDGNPIDACSAKEAEKGFNAASFDFVRSANERVASRIYFNYQIMICYSWPEIGTVRERVLLLSFFSFLRILVHTVCSA